MGKTYYWNTETDETTWDHPGTTCTSEGVHDYNPGAYIYNLHSGTFSYWVIGSGESPGKEPYHSLKSTTHALTPPSGQWGVNNRVANSEFFIPAPIINPARFG